MCLFDRSRPAERYVLNGENSPDGPPPEDADSYTFMCYEFNSFGVIGIAWLRTLCRTDIRSRRSNINEYFFDDARTGQIIAHEIGHNSGMSHDFTNSGVNDPRFCPEDGSSCKNVGGVMDYSQNNYTKWSCCSRNDFKNYYEANQPYCLDEGGNHFQVKP